jgi:hypothetical protein
LRDFFVIERHQLKSVRVAFDILGVYSS